MSRTDKSERSAAYCAKSIQAYAFVFMSEVHLGVLYLHTKNCVCRFTSFRFVCQKRVRHGQTLGQPGVWGGVSRCPNSLKVHMLAIWSLYKKIAEMDGACSTRIRETLL